jgi:hypothetical protein
MHDHWLFTWNVLSHLVASMSGFASFLMSLWEHSRRRKIESRVFFIVGVLCLVIAFDQAWQDEHRNSEILKAEKATLSSDAGFWKNQAYEKDTSLRSRDQLLAQNYTALIGQQSSANDSQSALAKLSDKILDIGKPQALRVVIQALMEPIGDGPVKVRYFIVLTNKTVTPAIVNVSCDQDITAGEGAVVGTTVMSAGMGPVIGNRRFNFSIASPAWSPQSPILVDVHYTGAQPNCGIEGVAQ